MKLTIKVALTISLFCSVALADGEMGTGTRSCTDNTQNCLVQNPADPTVNTNKDQKDSDDSIFIFVKDFLAKIFG